MLVFNTVSYAENLQILPKKKPNLEKKVIDKKIVQDVLKPKPKPKKVEIKAKEIKKLKKKQKKIKRKCNEKKSFIFSS